MIDVLVKTLFMFLLAFAISMFVAFLIYLIKKVLTSIFIISFFDEDVKKEAMEAKRIRSLKKQKMKKMMKEMHKEMREDSHDFHYGDNNDLNKKQNIY
ncbi:MAG: hypothetical protein WCK02_05835 [Bacteroidota bacterium]